MSGSYWTSTQRHKWQYTKAGLAKERQKLWMLECQLFPGGLNIVLDSKQPTNSSSSSEQTTRTSTIKNIPIFHRDLHYDRDYNLRIYCYLLIMKLGRRLNIRQVALATAHIYLSRFLLHASVREVNLYLLVTTCVYLACKVEECPQYIRSLVGEARSLWPEFIPPDPTKVTEFEFYLIEELESYLIVHHPYKSMEQIVEVLQQLPFNVRLSSDDIQNCWSLINDSYISDVHLIYPPHIIAMACMFITICIRDKSTKSIANSGTTTQQQTVVTEGITTSATTFTNMGQPQQQTIITSGSISTSSTNPLKKLPVPTSSSGSTTSNTTITTTNMPSQEHLSVQEAFNNFMAQSQVNLDEVMDAVQEQITLYDHWDKYNEPWVRFLLHTLYLRPSSLSSTSSVVSSHIGIE